MPDHSTADKLFQSLLRAQAQHRAGLPPVEKWRPALCGDLDMRIDRQGIWHYQGGAIQRPAMVKMFSSILKREGGEYFLVTPVEKWRIQVEDAPFILEDVRVEKPPGSDSVNDQALVFTSSVGTETVLGPDNPLWIIENPDSGEPRPYVRVRGNLDGLVQRHVFYHLVNMAVPDTIEGSNKLGVWSLGNFYRLE